MRTSVQTYQEFRPTQFDPVIPFGDERDDWLAAPTSATRDAVMLRRFRIEYQDASGDGPVFCDVRRGHNEEHAVERFLSAPDAEGWKVVSITPIHAEQPRRARKERR